MPQVKVHKDVSARKDNFSCILLCKHLHVSTILLNTHTHTHTHNADVCILNISLKNKPFPFIFSRYYSLLYHSLSVPPCLCMP